jgi:hypothetical protein
MTNAIIQIEVYSDGGIWFFDCKEGVLSRQPLGDLADVIGDFDRGASGSGSGFTLLLSEMPFPDYQIELLVGGQWYGQGGKQGQGLICPSLFGCFDPSPDVLYIKAAPPGTTAVAEAEPQDVAALRRRIDELENAVYQLTMENELLKAARNPPPTDERPYWQPNSFEDA